MTTLEYKGYTASVTIDTEAKILYGRVLYLRDVIDFKAESVFDLEAEFHESIDGYLEWCDELGEAPEKPFSGQFVVRIEPELHRNAAIAAARADESLNEWVKGAVREKLHLAMSSPKVEGRVDLQSTATRADVLRVESTVQTALQALMPQPDPQAYQRTMSRTHTVLDTKEYLFTLNAAPKGFPVECN